MPKARMTALDVRAMTTNLRPLVQRLRVANVYDISSKVYVLKLSEGETKRHLVLEAGTRFHLSQWKRDKQAVPSVFTMKLRKHIRTKRLTDLKQLGTDRVIDLQFGREQHAVHLIVELYSRGNVVLCDHEYLVIATWRQFRREENPLAVKVHMLYPVEKYINNIPPVLRTLRDKGGIEVEDIEKLLTVEDEDDRMNEESNAVKASEGTAVVKGLNESRALTNSAAMARLLPLSHKALIEHCCARQKIDSDAPMKLEDVLAGVKDIIGIFESLSTKDIEGAAPGDSPQVKGFLHFSSDSINEDFSPVLIKGKPNWNVKEFDSFHECVDTYYSSLEVQRAMKSQSEKLNELESKIGKIKSDQKERVDKLKAERDIAEKQADVVEQNLDFVHKALEMLKRAVSTGSDWKLIEQTVKEQRKLNHPIASHIQALELKKNRFTLLLAPEKEDEEEDEEDQPLIPVHLSIDETAFGNVERLHAEKKAAHLKFLKTQAAAERVVAAAEAAAEKERASKASKVHSRPAIQRLRKYFWFEKFHWFISSDNYLVIAGRDATQNEVLYRKYLMKHDLYVHADVHGAASCIIRNPKRQEVPQWTIEQAGIMSVCRSNAWKTKILATAYWVYAHQVSKTPQAGEYVSTGGFIIRGKRNPIIIRKLEMGIGVLFHLGDEESVRRHLSPEDLIMSGAAKMGSVEEAASQLEEAASQLEESSDGLEGRPQGSSERQSVQFGSVEVLPTPEIEAKVDFIDLPPEVILVNSSKSILSEEEEGEEESGQGGESEESMVEETLPARPCQSRSFDLRRPDSADELPPPILYEGRAAPRDLLAKRTPETSFSLAAPESDSDGGESEETSLCLTAPVLPLTRADTESTQSLMKLRKRGVSVPLLPSNLNKRRLVVDGGPPPRGFLEDQVPPPRQLLQHAFTWNSLKFTREQLSSSSIEISTGPRRQTMDDHLLSQHQPTFHSDPIGCTSLWTGLKDDDFDHTSRFTDQTPLYEATEQSPKQPVPNNPQPKAPQNQKSQPPRNTPARKAQVVTKKIKQSVLPRGKRTKLKKMRQKYAEQSDEEKEIALKLIGTTRIKQERTSSEPPPPIVNESPKPTDPYYWSQTTKPELQDRDIAAEDSDVEVKDEASKDRISVLNELTGKPMAKDTLLCALPVCAPLPALANYTLTGRLLPGGGKKGQAVSVILKAFVEMTLPDSVQRQLVRQITTDEIAACLVANPIVDIKGGNRIQKAEMKAKKDLKRSMKTIT